MLSVRKLALLLALVGFATCAPHPTARVELEPERTTPPLSWVKVGPAPPNHPLTLTLAVKLRNSVKLKELTLAVSEPESPQYGQHVSISDLKSLVGPTEATLSKIRAWLNANDISAINPTEIGHFVQVEATVRQAENLLQTRFHSWRHTSGAMIVRAHSYSVPKQIAELLDFIGGVLRFPPERAIFQHVKRDIEQFSTTPSVIKNRYNITDQGQSSSNLQSVNQFLQQYYSPQDLAQFFKKFGLPENKVANVVGPNKPGDPGLEASLDIEYIMGVAVNVPTWFVYTAGNDNGGQEPFLEWIVKLSNTSNAPWVNSVSYGDVESSISDSYLQRMESEFQMIGARGISILFASGDSGVGCTSACRAFTPDWPASSAFVTTVGGTQLDRHEEDAVSFSGGGFSNAFPRPSYQDSAVEAFLNSSNLPAPHFYNATGRAYPDISALAVDFTIVVDGSSTFVDGTSCAAPTAAAIISLLNDLRLQKGESTLGFLNPWLYSTADSSAGAIYDVTDGNNGAGCCPGFDAKAGWDPVSGIGTLNYAVLKTMM